MFIALSFANGLLNDVLDNASTLRRIEHKQLRDSIRNRTVEVFASRLLN
jgi:hypothetical protein